MNSAPILPAHLRKKAVIYIRQSTGHQVLTNQESQRMQRDMKEHALRLGWPESAIEIVEADTGTSAQSTAGRSGFKNMLSQLALGEIGIVLSYESTRLSRNCSDWYPLLDLCTMNQCLIGDRDGVYDPSTANGRLLLGMKGMVSELELHTLRGRLNAGIDNKARRGELQMRLPVGYVHLDDGAIVKDPDLQVQESISLVFKSFLELRCCRKVVQHLRKHGLLLPALSLTERRVQFRTPSSSAVLRLLRNPTYAGAYVFGRTCWQQRKDPKRPGYQSYRLPQDQWRVVLKDHFAGYIDWDTFARIQDILAKNYAHYRRRESQGVAREGAALLSGICYCGHCGLQMTAAYTSQPYYRCCRCIRPDEPKPSHESIRSDLVDPYVQQSFFDALSPVELDLYEAAYHRTQEQQQQVCAAQERQLQRLRYEANRARRQYDQADPENRLVTLELERRWEAALRALSESEQRYEQDQRQMRAQARMRIPLELRTEFATVGQALPQLWPQLRMATRKELLRCLVSKVVLTRLPSEDRLLVRIIWRGGAYTDKELAVPPPGRHTPLDHAALAPRVVALAEQGCSDEQIAQQLTSEGFRSSRATSLHRHTVGRIRRQQGNTHRQAPPQRRYGGAWSVTRVATLLGVPRQWLYSLIYRGVLKLARDPDYGSYVFPGRPETLERLRQLRSGLIHDIDFTSEHQDA